MSSKNRIIQPSPANFINSLSRVWFAIKVAVASRPRLVAFSIGLLVLLHSGIPAQASSVKLGWDPVPETDIQGYRVYVGTQSQQYATSQDTAAGTSINVNDLETGRTYYFAVTSIGSTGLESERSEELSVTLVSAEPMVVENSSSVTLGWNPVPETDIRGYRVYSGTQSGQYSEIHDTGTGTTYDMADLVYGQTYYFAVSAVGSTGVEGPRSDELVVTLMAPESVAVADSYSTPRNVTLAVPDSGVFANDALFGSEPFIAMLNTAPEHGTVSLNEGGGFNYTPATGYTGSDSFSYHANASDVNSNIVTVEITVDGSTSAIMANGSPSLSGKPGAMVIGMAVVTAGSYVLERSADLVTWEFVSEIQLLEAGPLEFQDNKEPQAAEDRMFYRIGSAAFTPGS